MNAEIKAGIKEIKLYGVPEVIQKLWGIGELLA
jgi:hypothetical protein